MSPNISKLAGSGLLRTSGRSGEHVATGPCRPASGPAGPPRWARSAA
eukprot:CAMPEP_0204216786 /NCGR_PEP_ID=MMETSP0361-20130328/78444_1 /ASSEMBLY_ACC=CAM_ASM_000343 /TAXON_ID=268821 /ORGANISM="Scrippsiella Hangoei, Strain SHTV-5" /LENGTH=46 /DNA_ID= /DNA_START= /DNA_END= /DNA_ORIENTATION=